MRRANLDRQNTPAQSRRIDIPKRHMERAANRASATSFGRRFLTAYRIKNRQGFADLCLVKGHLLGIEQSLQSLQARRFHRLIDLVFSSAAGVPGRGLYLNEKACA